MITIGENRGKWGKNYPLGIGMGGRGKKGIPPYKGGTLFSPPIPPCIFPMIFKI